MHRILFLDVTGYCAAGNAADDQGAAYGQYDDSFLVKDLEHEEYGENFDQYREQDHKYAVMPFDGKDPHQQYCDHQRYCVYDRLKYDKRKKARVVWIFSVFVFALFDDSKYGKNERDHRRDKC